MSLALVLVLGAGASGGAVNALLTDNGFVLPRRETDGKASILRPGFVGNVLVGAVAALVSWGLYGPLAAAPVAGTATVELSWTVLAGSVLVGMGGSRWLSAEVDKKLLAAAVARTTESPLAERVEGASPAETFRLVRGEEPRGG